MELDHRPVTSLGQFRRAVDRTPPGTPLPVKVYRAGQFMDYTVAVGREQYQSGGNLTICFPTGGAYLGSLAQPRFLLGRNWL